MFAGKAWACNSGVRQLTDYAEPRLWSGKLAHLSRSERDAPNYCDARFKLLLSDSIAQYGEIGQWFVLQQRNGRYYHEMRLFIFF